MTQSNQVSFLRHNSFFGPEDCDDKVLNIIGAGATGSWVALLAAKMGWHNFKIWDQDLVESHNLPNQAYDVSHVGLLKVDALKNVLTTFNPQISVTTFPHFFEGSNASHLSELEDYVFVAVDSLSARKDIVENLIYHPFAHTLFETKMGFTHAALNIIKTNDKNSMVSFLNMLKTDEEVTESACNERIITTLTNVVSSNLVHFLCAHASLERRNPSEDFDYYGQHLFNFDNSKLNIYKI